MEDIGYFIEISLGVTLFVLALTISILLYSSMENAVDAALLVNDMNEEIVSSDDAEKLLSREGVLYTKAETYSIIRDLLDLEEGILVDLYSPFVQLQRLILVKADGTSYTYNIYGDIPRFIESLHYILDHSNELLKSDYYEIEYTYGYKTFDRSSINNHYVIEMKVTATTKFI